MFRFKIFCLVVTFQFILACDLTFHVQYLDKKICEEIKNPILLGGKYLYRDLLDLAIFLQKIEHTMKDGNRDGDKEAIAILEEGGLHLPNITQDDGKIMEAYNWTKSQAEELRLKTKDVASRWNNILKGLKRAPMYPVDYDIDSEKFVHLSQNVSSYNQG